MQPTHGLAVVARLVGCKKTPPVVIAVAKYIQHILPAIVARLYLVALCGLEYEFAVQIIEKIRQLLAGNAYNLVYVRSPAGYPKACFVFTTGCSV